jgi:predicted dehydrogenase
MSKSRFGVGIIGLQPNRSCACVAYIPALRALSDTFDIVGIANTNKESAEKAAAAYNIPALSRMPLSLPPIRASTSSPLP